MLDTIGSAPIPTIPQVKPLARWTAASKWIAAGCLLLATASPSRSREAGKPAQADPQGMAAPPAGTPSAPQGPVCNDRCQVRVEAPTGSRVLFYADGGHPLKYSSTATVGLRALHRYAIAVEGLPNAPDATYFGTIEVVRAPHVLPGVDAKLHPVPVVIDETDVRSLLANRMISKFLVIEDPATAIDRDQDAGDVIRYDVSLSGDPIAAAKELGKIVLVFRMGNRVPTATELASTLTTEQLSLPYQRLYLDAPILGSPGHSSTPMLGVDGSIQRTSFHMGRPRTDGGRRGGAACAHPGFGPCSANGVPCVRMPNYPCPWGPLHEEYLCDGGDRGLAVWLDGRGNWINLDDGDTAARYLDNLGKRRITASNEVCVYAPRYVEVRHIQVAEAHQDLAVASSVARDDASRGYVQAIDQLEEKQYVMALGTRSRQRASGLKSEVEPNAFSEIRVLEGFELRLGWAAAIGVREPKVVSNSEQPVQQAAVQFARTLTKDEYPQVIGMVEGVGQLITFWREQEYVTSVETPEKPTNLVLTKRADRAQAKIGDEITFEIEFKNAGTKPISSIGLVDSLTSRLQYVPESAKSDRDAMFLSESNDGGSQTLRWEIKDPLPAGASGKVHFKARVR